MSTGFREAPPHYSKGERETIDIIRDSMEEHEFRAFCYGNALKYLSRAGHKENTDDAAKAAWYVGMVLHIDGEGPDPRDGRSGFTSYAKQDSTLADARVAYRALAKQLLSRGWEGT